LHRIGGRAEFQATQSPWVGTGAIAAIGVRPVDLLPQFPRQSRMAAGRPRIWRL